MNMETKTCLLAEFSGDEEFDASSITVTVYVRGRGPTPGEIIDEGEQSFWAKI